MSPDEYIFGWLDLNNVQYVERLNELSSVFVTHVDLLDDLKEFKICTGYSVHSSVDSGEPMIIEGRMPCNIRELGSWKAKYQKMHGWEEDTQKLITFGSVPDELQTFVRQIETKVKAEVVFVSTNAKEDEGMIRVRHGA